MTRATVTITTDFETPLSAYDAKRIAGDYWAGCHVSDFVFKFFTAEDGTKPHDININVQVDTKSTLPTKPGSLLLFDGKWDKPGLVLVNGRWYDTDSGLQWSVPAVEQELSKGTLVEAEWSV